MDCTFVIWPVFWPCFTLFYPYIVSCTGPGPYLVYGNLPITPARRLARGGTVRGTDRTKCTGGYRAMKVQYGTVSKEKNWPFVVVSMRTDD